MAERTTITHEEAAEVKQLWAEYDAATRLALHALSMGGGSPGNPAYQDFLAQDARAGKAVKRIKEIYGRDSSL